MRNFRLLIVALATICVLALGVFALVSPGQAPGDDVIIIKGGSLEIQCGKNHGLNCLGTPDGKGKYKHQKAGHIMQVVVKDYAGTTVFSSAFNASTQPQIEITYK
jgi:hypothetical protein